jgi:hypothetical protein
MYRYGLVGENCLVAPVRHETSCIPRKSSEYALEYRFTPCF